MEWYGVLLVKIILILLGLAMIFKPKLIWKINTFGVAKGGEPTKFYIAISALVGGIVIIYAVVSLLLSI